MRPSECAKVSGSRSSGSSGTTLSTAEQDAACLGDQWRHQHWSAVLVSIRVRGAVMTAGCGGSLMEGVAWLWQVTAEVVRVRPSPRVTAQIKKWGEPQTTTFKKKLTGRCSSCATAVVQYAAANQPNVTSSKWAWTRHRRWLECITSITSITVAANAGKARSK